MRVESLCTRSVAVAPPEETVAAAAKRMADQHLGTLVVVDSLQRPLGIATDRDLALRCLTHGKVDPDRVRLSEVMSAPAAWVHEQTPLAQAVDEMARLRVRRLPVVDASDRLVGILSLDDVMAERLSDDQDLQNALRASMT